MGAKPCTPLFFTFHRKRGYLYGLGRISGEVGAKRSRCRGGGVDNELPNDNGAGNHFDGIGKMVPQRFKRHHVSPLHMNQSRRVRPALHCASGRCGCRPACCAAAE